MNQIAETKAAKAVHSTLFQALAAAQAEMGPALKDSVNPAFKSRYADLASVMAACIPALSAHGIAVLQPPCEIDSENLASLTKSVVSRSYAFSDRSLRKDASTGTSSTWMNGSSDTPQISSTSARILPETSASTEPLRRISSLASSALTDGTSSHRATAARSSSLVVSAYEP